ncbi:MAG: DUF3365 domain-containing protein [Hymenobacteraceae bacterium]|nr:DUF3365 domain-containing protein [Hymenobacteraceae bacterium]
MKLIKLLVVLSAAAGIVASCDTKQIEGSKEIAAEIERHKVKRFTKDQIHTAAMQAGDSIVNLAQDEMVKLLHYGLESGGVEEAMEYCYPAKYPTVELLANYYGATVSRTSTQLRNPDNKPFAAADTVLQHYAAEAQKGAVPATGKLTQTADDVLLYTRPITISNAVCLKCHGKVGEKIVATDYAAIKAKYPADEAVGYKEGEWRGMWQIRFPYKGLLNHLTQTGRKKSRRRG